MMAIGLFVFLAGLATGSFLNVCIWRLPRGESLLAPPSHCPACDRPIGWWDNIPLLSYALLLGRCRGCGTAISARYPAVELLSALLWTALWWRWGRMKPEGFWFAPACLAGDVLLLIAFIDCYTRRIPDVLSIGLLVLGLLASPFNPELGAGPSRRILLSAAGAGAGFIICWGVAALGRFIFKREAMGWGDVLMLAGVGAWGGPLGAYDCLVLGSLAGSAFAAVLFISGRVRRRAKIPFGPFLTAGAIANLFWLMPFGFPG